jgi:hypothetical protein
MDIPASLWLVAMARIGCADVVQDYEELRFLADEIVVVWL